MHAGARATRLFRACKLLQPCTPQGLAAFDTFALAIRRVGPDGTHCGVLFQSADGTPWILHLAWNYRLMSGPVDDQYAWVEASLAASNRKLLAILADRIWNRQPQIPYGLTSLGVSFDPESGNINTVPPGHGLTCASFILTLLRSKGFHLLDEDTWPENANDAWHTWVVETLTADSDATEEQVRAVAATVGSRRFRPAEVVGSGTLAVEQWPVGFDSATAVAREIESELIAA